MDEEEGSPLLSTETKSGGLSAAAEPFGEDQAGDTDFGMPELESDDDEGSDVDEDETDSDLPGLTDDAEESESSVQGIADGEQGKSLVTAASMPQNIPPGSPRNTGIPFGSQGSPWIYGSTGIAAKSEDWFGTPNAKSLQYADDEYVATQQTSEKEEPKGLDAEEELVGSPFFMDSEAPLRDVNVGIQWDDTQNRARLSLYGDGYSFPASKKSTAFGDFE